MPIVRRTPSLVLADGRRVAWILVVLWMAGIVAASLSPNVASPEGTDVWLHAMAYGVCTLLLRRAFLLNGLSRSLAIPGLAAWGYGLLLEGAQAALPYRTAEVRDLLANAAGVAAAIMLAASVPRMRRSRSEVS